MRRRRRITVAAIAAAAITACLLATSSASALPRVFYGVNSAETPTGAELNRLGAGGMGSLRINMVWGQVQSGPEAAYDWGLYDQIVGEAAQNGIQVLPIFYSSPGWAAPTHEHPPAAEHVGRFRAFVRAAAERYGNNGEFWTLNPATPKIAITDWQVWNESNSPQFWAPKPNAKRYVKLLRVARAGIKAGDPQARIVLAGFFPAPGTNLAVPVTRYLTQIYRSKGRPLFDAVAIHPYSAKPRDALEPLREVRKIMGRFKDRRKPLWITEIGWASGGQRTPLTVSPQRQAGYLRQTYSLMARNRKRLKIQRVFWYSLRDAGSRIWYENTGLFTQAGGAKPSWSAFTRLTGGTP
jgi:hypothetical protein